MDDLDLTPTQLRIFNVLSDGEPHSKTEILACMNEDQPSRGLMDLHIHNLRNKISHKGLTVIYQSFGNRIKVRMVRIYNRSTE